MNAVLGSLSEIVTSLFQSLRLSFVVPAIIFWVLNRAFIFSNLPDAVKDYLAGLAKLFSMNSLTLISILSLLSGYFLFVLNTSIIRWFEGYPWKGHWLGSWLAEKKIEWHKCQKLRIEERCRIVLLRQQLTDLRNKLSEEGQDLSINHPKRIAINKEIVDIRDQLEAAQLDDRQEIEQAILAKELKYRYPTLAPPSLPTGLGNAIASFENYPSVQYGMDAITLWPRLVPIISKEKYALFVEREKANLDFMLNTCLVMIMLSVELFLVGYFFAVNIWMWVLASGYLLALAYFVFYKTSIVGAVGWGNTVRVAFDLYRYQLLASLYGRGPVDFREEKRIWLNLSAFYREHRADIPAQAIDFVKVREAVAQPHQNIQLSQEQKE